MNIEIKRAYARKDAKRLSRLDREIFKYDAYTGKEWRGHKCFWITVGGKIVGSLAMEHNIIGNYLYIASIGVLPSFQGKGIGTQALNWQIEYARKQGFGRVMSHIRLSNKKSIYLHEKAGFEMTGIETAYYLNPRENAAIMELSIDK